MSGTVSTRVRARTRSGARTKSVRPRGRKTDKWIPALAPPAEVLSGAEIERRRREICGRCGLWEMPGGCRECPLLAFLQRYAAPSDDAAAPLEVA